jgi:hypothetical protein
MSKTKTIELSSLPLSDLMSLLKSAKQQENKNKKHKNKIKNYERKKKALQNRIANLDAKILKASQTE